MSRVAAAKKARKLLRRRRRGPVAAIPGTLDVDPNALPPKLHVFAYEGETLIDEPLEDLDRIPKLRKRFANGVVWIDVVGLGDAAVLEKLQSIFDLHSLAMEDVVHLNQRAKSERYGKHVFTVVRMARRDQELLDLEQVSFFLGDHFVLSFQERPGDVFEPIRARLRESRGRVRRMGADYLLYALLDAVVDGAFPVVEGIGDELEEIEAQVLQAAADDQLARIHALKRELLALRRATWPLREAIQTMIRDECVSEEVELFLRDAMDHTVQVVEMVESQREICSGLLDMYMTQVSNRMNEIMKVLTIMSTIFIPLGFVAGLYGMNFDANVSPYNMPELSQPYGYPVAVAAMVAIAAGMLVFFRRRGWI